MAINPQRYGNELIEDEEMGFYPEGADYLEEEETPEEEMDENQERLGQLRAWIDMDNIAEDLSDEELGTLAAQCKLEYDIDVESRADWTKQIEDAIDLAKQVAEEKSYPWPKAANVKVPLVTVAAIQFNARSYPAIVQNPLVRTKVNGFDMDGSKHARANRVSKMMSWQLLEQMEEWEEETDKLLTVLPITGMAFRKTYFSSTLNRNVSELVLAQDLVFNYSAKSFDACPVKTQKIELYPHEIRERVLDGTFLDIEYGTNPGTDSDNDANNPHAPHLFLEQHRLWDLDGDDYPEPYVVTIHAPTGKVCRIVARYRWEGIKTNGNNEVIRIEPEVFFTKYGFLPNPDGSAHDIGFGALLGPINESTNTVINQMLDAGHLQIVGGGFIGSGLRMKGGPIRMRLGEYVPINVPGGKIRENLVSIQHPGPNAILFQLLGMMIEMGREIASTKDVLQGSQQASNVPASTTLALIEQGLKVFNAIYKRVHRSVGQELKKIYRLNGQFMPPQVYIQFLDSDKPTVVLLQDFQDKDMDVRPMSDPGMVTDMQLMARAELLLPFAPDPDFDGIKIKKRYLEAAGIPDIDELMAKPEERQQKMMMGMQQMMQELQNRQKEANAKLIQAQAAMAKAESGKVKDMASAALDIQKAEAEQLGSQLNEIVTYINTLMQVEERVNAGPGNVSGTQAQPGVQGAPGAAQGPGGVAPGQVAGGGVPAGGP